MVERLGGGASRAEGSLAIESVGLAGGVQIVASGLGARERPIVFLAPGVLAQHENLDRLLAFDSLSMPFRRWSYQRSITSSSWSSVAAGPKSTSPMRRPPPA